MPVIKNPYTGTPMVVPFDAPTLMPPPSPTGTWLLVNATEHARDWRGRHTQRAGLRYIRQQIPTVPFHPLDEHDPRVAELARGRRVSLPAPTFRICQPQAVGARWRGLIAVSLASGSTWKEGTPNLWIEGEPFGFLQNIDHSVYSWIQRAAADNPRPSWFTTDGASLWRLVVATRTPQHYLAFGVERVA